MTDRFATTFPTFAYTVLRLLQGPELAECVNSANVEAALRWAGLVAHNLDLGPQKLYKYTVCAAQPVTAQSGQMKSSGIAPPAACRSGNARAAMRVSRWRQSLLMKSCLALAMLNGMWWLPKALSHR